ncbi:MAG TPA: heavy metal translocating P-type ATPase [Ktedonobacterales bacterium]|nr:heavy metal translocating P-type ATPase [Ktedonobacterales bacterium]
MKALPALHEQITVVEPPVSDDARGELHHTPPSTRLRHLWHVLRRYPLPVGALVLLALALVLWAVAGPTAARWPLLAIILLGGVPLLWKTVGQLLRGEFGVDLIAILAIGGSLLLGQYLAGAMIVLMLSGGEALEAYALRRARRSLATLAERAPRTAHRRHGNEVISVAAASVEVGDEVVVTPGELVPVDGLVVGGASNVSEADLTGEPLPARKETGALVLSGSVNLDGVLDVRATRRAADSHFAQIVRLVEDAQQRKAPIHRLADRYAVWFTALSILMAAGAWVLSGDSLFALAVLVVATPCPLILATPIAIMSGIDRAARQGLIVKSGAAIEQLGEVDVAVFDKTGTLTLGTPQLVEVLLDEAATSVFARRLEVATALQLAASVEQFSSHILARAVVEAARRREIALLPVCDVEEVPGKGVHGRVTLPDKAGSVADGSSDTCRSVTVALGNRTFMRYLDLALPEPLAAERERRAAHGQIASFLALDGRISGLLVFADVPRPELARLAPELKAANVTETILLTGDGEAVARQIASLAGVDRVVAQCLPEQKVQVIEAELAQGKRVLMVGDGVNDAPALALATVGIAMGSQGLTPSASVADAVLLSPDILKIASAVHLGRRVMRIARQGIWIGMGLSFVAMIFAALGYIPPAVGAVLQEGVDIVVILNALRAGRV